MNRNKTTAFSIAAIIAVAILVVRVATTVSSATSAYAWGNSGNKKQAKVIVENKCANVDDNNKRVHINNIRCQINDDDIQGIGSLPFLTDGRDGGVVTLEKTK